MRTERINPQSLRYVLDNLRECDRTEIYGLQWFDEPELILKQLCHGDAFGWVVGLDRPVAAVGAYPLRPGVWSAYCFGTDEWYKIVLSLTRFVIRDIKPRLLAAGAHRVEAYSLADHHEAHRWMTLFGAELEGRHQHAGKNGEDYVTVAWVRDVPRSENSEG